MKKELINLALSGFAKNILHVAEIGGVVAIVEDRKGVRWYHAMNYTQDEDGEWSCTGGYSTSDKHWYMGERYRVKELWGEYFNEIFS